MKVFFSNWLINKYISSKHQGYSKKKLFTIIVSFYKKKNEHLQQCKLIFHWELIWVLVPNLYNVEINNFICIMTLINRLIIVILYRPIKKSQQRETDLLRN